MWVVETFRRDAAAFTSPPSRKSAVAASSTSRGRVSGRDSHGKYGRGRNSSGDGRLMAGSTIPRRRSPSDGSVESPDQTICWRARKPISKVAARVIAPGSSEGEIRDVARRGGGSGQTDSLETSLSPLSRQRAAKMTASSPPRRDGPHPYRTGGHHHYRQSRRSPRRHARSVFHSVNRSKSVLMAGSKVMTKMSSVACTGNRACPTKKTA